MKAVRLAEAATLGSLMIEPAALTKVATWLRAGDFVDPWHGELYAVLRERLVARQAVDPESVGVELRDRIGPHRADLVRVAGLLRAAPVPARPLHYAAMVLECSLRREVAGQGVLLRASALSASLTQQRHPVVTGTALVDDALTAAEGRWQLASGGPPSGAVAHPELAPALRNLGSALAADRLLAAHPGLDLQQVREHERRLVAALVRHPDQVRWASAWLTPEALLDRPWRAVYAALVDLVDGGKPVDVVSVAWQVQHASRRLGPGPDLPTLVRDVDAAAVDDPRYYSRYVAADLVRRTADSAARAMFAAAENPGIDVPDLFKTARLVTASVRSAGSGLPDRANDVRSGRHLTAVNAEPTWARAAEIAGPVAG